MKRWKLLLSMILCCGMTVPGLIGCGSDDGNGTGGGDSIPNDLIGTWQFVGSPSLTYTFSSDGNTTVRDTSVTNCMPVHYTVTVSGSRICSTGGWAENCSNPSPGLFENYCSDFSISGNTLRFFNHSAGAQPTEWVRVGS